MKKTIAAFDVFDTVVIRKVVLPHLVFEQVYYTVRDQNNILDSVSLDEFVLERVRSESELLQKQDEVKMHDIVDVMCQKLDIASEFVDVLVDAELEVEYDVIVPSDIGLRLVDSARTQSHRIIYISDTYLPEEFLRKVLVNCRLLKCTDELYVSSSYGKTKRSGSLYDVVKQNYPADEYLVRMHGDNLRSDVQNANKAGFSAKLVVNTHINKSRLTVNSMFGATKSTLALKVLSVTHFSENRSYKESKGKGGLDVENQKFVSSILGPLSLLWAIWVVKISEKQGLDQILFLARDSRLPYECYKILESIGCTALPAVYVPASRKSLLNACIVDQDISSLKKLFNPAETLDLDIVGNRLGIDLKSPSVRRRFGSRKFEWSELLNLLRDISKSKCMDRIIGHGRRQTALFHRYYSELGVMLGGKLGVVDVGWHLNTQSALGKIFKSSQFFGLYLHASRERRNLKERYMSNFTTMFSDNDAAFGAGLYSPKLYLHRHVVESLLGIDPVGTFVGFDCDCLPVYESIGSDEKYLKAELTNESLEFVRENANFYFHQFRSADDCASAFTYILDNFLAHPKSEYVAILNKMSKKDYWVDNPETGPLVGKLSFFSEVVPGSFLSRWQVTKNEGWREGSACISSAPVRYIYTIKSILRKNMSSKISYLQQKIWVLWWN